MKQEQLAYSLDAVPYMPTLNGQTFAQAFANIYQAVSTGQTPAAQPFFESAMGGPSFCTGFASCTASNILTTHVYDMWGALNKAPGWTLGRTMPSSNPAQASGIPDLASIGFSNYNGVFLSMRMNDWHGLTATSNLTFSRTLGTGQVTQAGTAAILDQWNVQSMYGPQAFDIKWVYNLLMLYQVSALKGQHGLLGRALGGWAIAPLFTAQSGGRYPCSSAEERAMTVSPSARWTAPRSEPRTTKTQ